MDEIYALLWSRSSNCFHIEPLADTARNGMRFFSRDARNDYLLLAFGSRQKCKTARTNCGPRSQSGSTAWGDRDTAGGSNCCAKHALHPIDFMQRKGFCCERRRTWTFGARQTTGGEMTCATCSHWNPKASGPMSRHRMALCNLGTRWTFYPPQHNCKSTHRPRRKSCRAGLHGSTRRGEVMLEQLVTQDMGDIVRGHQTALKARPPKGQQMLRVYDFMRDFSARTISFLLAM